ncbi:hypothetical protein ACER0C_012205 [Sarotherodon galilaeus]
MHRVERKTIVRTKVNHSMRLSQKPLQPWVILQSNGDVESAHCTCMAGVAEKCVHVAALLYKIDTTVHLRGNITPTDVQAYWIMPSNMKRVQGVPGHAIDYTTSAARKRALDRSISEGQSDLRTLAELKPLTDLMHENRSGLCAVMEEFCHLYADPVQPCVLPKSLLRLYDPQMKGCELSVLLQHCDRLKHCVARKPGSSTNVTFGTQHEQEESLHQTYMRLCPPPLPLLRCQLLRKCATHKNCHISSQTLNRNKSSGEKTMKTQHESGTPHRERCDIESLKWRSVVS